MSGRFYRGLTATCVVVAAFGVVQLLSAQDRGDQVVVVVADAQMDIPGHGALSLEPGDILTVRGTRGNWLRVDKESSGWIAKSAVVKLEEADAYLSKKTQDAAARFEDFHALAQFRGVKSGWQQAISVYDSAILKFPESAMAFVQRGIANSKLGNTKDAVVDYEKAISIDANQAVALNNLAWIHATGEAAFRDGKKALDLALRAKEITQGRDSSILDTLAAAHAELGRFGDAAKWEIAAIRLKERGAAADALYQRLKLYSEKQAYRASSR